MGEQGLIFLFGLSRVNFQWFGIKWKSLHEIENLFFFFFPPLP